MLQLLTKQCEDVGQLMYRRPQKFDRYRECVSAIISSLPTDRIPELLPYLKTIQLELSPPSATSLLNKRNDMLR